MAAEISEQVQFHSLKRIRESANSKATTEGSFEHEANLQTTSNAPGKHIATISEQQQRNRQKRSKALRYLKFFSFGRLPTDYFSKQLTALLSSRSETRQTGDGSGLPLILHTDSMIKA